MRWSVSVVCLLAVLGGWMMEGVSASQGVGVEAVRTLLGENVRIPSGS